MQSDCEHNAAGDQIISGTIVDISHVSFERPWRGITVERQWEANRAAGAQFRAGTKRYNLSWQNVVRLADKKPASAERWTLYVYLLSLLIGPREPGEPPPAAQLSLALGEITARGWIVVETYTGRRSDNAAEWRDMVSWAHASLARGVRSPPPGFASPGRKKGVPPDVEAEALKVWHDLDYPTDAAAARHFPEGVNLAFARRWFKPSGRPPGAKPKMKKRRK